MTAFSYQAARSDGGIVSGWMEAASRDVVREEIRRRRMYPVEIREASGSAGWGERIAGWSSILRSDRDRRLEFTRELATLLKAGFSLDQSLGLVAEIVRDHAVGTMAQELRAQLRRGSPLSAALVDQPSGFPDFYVSLIAAGEENGMLETVVGRLGEYLEEEEALREEIKSALAYPILMTVIGGLAVAVLLVFVIPKLVTLLQETGQSLPLATTMLVAVGGFAGRFWWAMPGLAAVVAWGVSRLRGSPPGRRRLDELDLTLPVWGGLRQALLASRFCRTLGILLQSGLPLLPALQSAARTVPNVVAREALERARETVRRGGGFGEALDAQRAPLPPLVVQMIRLGEQSGELESMLERTADLFERRARRTTARLVSLLEPGLILLFAGIVGFVAIAMLQAILTVQRVPM